MPGLTYGLYSQISSTRGAVVHRVPMRELAIDLGALAETAREVDARIAWVCDPNNPTGFALAPSEWKDFLDALPDGVLPSSTRPTPTSSLPSAASAASSTSQRAVA